MEQDKLNQDIAAIISDLAEIKSSLGELHRSWSEFKRPSTKPYAKNSSGKSGSSKKQDCCEKPNASHDSKESHSERNPGRFYRYCRNCGGFISWVDEEKSD